MVYIDYGNYESVSFNETRDMTLTFAELPRQSVTGRLSRIDYSSPFDKKHEEKFKAMCLNQNFIAQFTSRQVAEDVWQVELYHITGDFTKNIFEAT